MAGTGFLTVGVGLTDKQMQKVRMIHGLEWKHQYELVFNLT